MVETLTYEDIYEILRAEKYSTDLQPLKEVDLKKFKEYFDAKKAMLAKQTEGASFFDRSKKGKLKAEIENARRALRDLYERREKKVINRAIFTSRSGFKVKDSSNMLPSEEKLYSVLVELLKTSTTEFFINFNSPQAKNIEKRPEQAEPKELKEPEQAVKKVLVRFVELVPKLVGPDLQSYGPFEKEDVANLPEEIVALLLKQKKVEEIKNEDSKKD